jgi:hypothetical protein
MINSLTRPPIPGSLEQNSWTFRNLVAAAGNWDREFSEMDRVPVERMEVTETGLIFDNNNIPIDQNARARLLAKAGAPVSYLAKRRVDIQVLALREHLEQGDFGDTVTPVLRCGQLFTIQCGRLVELTNSEVLTAVADSLGNDADGLSLSRIDRADSRLELDLVSPAKALEIRRGDIVKAGLHILHSRYGDEATQIQAFIYRLVCANGMTRRECISAGGIVRTRKLPAGHPRGKELLLDQVRRLAARTWQALEQQLTELRATSERRADVHQLLKQWLQRARISTRITEARSTDSARTVMDRLLRAWRAEGSEDTYYGAVNALTWVGSHDLELTPRQRRVLSMLGGLLAFSGVHICPRCFSVLSDSAQAREEQTAESVIAMAQNEIRTRGPGVPHEWIHRH